LLCTDGLFNEVSDDEIASVVRDGGDAASVAGALVDGALVNGAGDDVTVVIAEVRR
jgi:protein phosphatase